MSATIHDERSAVGIDANLANYHFDADAGPYPKHGFHPPSSTLFFCTLQGVCLFVQAYTSSVCACA